MLLKGASGYLPNHMKYFGVWCTSMWCTLMSNNKEMVIEYRFKSRRINLSYPSLSFLVANENRFPEVLLPLTGMTTWKKINIHTGT